MSVCSICKKIDDNSIDYGEFMNRSDISVHYYCLLLSTNLPQKGTDHAGILGFLLKDIRQEIKRAADRICCYCKEPNASIACLKCNQYFHFVCGDRNGCVSEFVNEFHSYCHKHVPFRNEKELIFEKNTSNCWICHETLGEFSPTKCLRSYCCNNGYVHRYCLRKYAIAAGYHLVCIWCTSKTFRDDVRKHGVFVPDREAIWDNNETLRYTDLHRGYSRCDAKVCICPQGREYFKASWKLLVCSMCGASGVHNKCGKDHISKDVYTCEMCNQILKQSQRKSNEQKKTNNFGANYTMFISKKKKENEDNMPTIVISSSPEPEVTEEENSKSKQPSTSGQSLQQKPQMREMLMFGKTGDIVGTVVVDKNKLVPKPDNFFACKEEDVQEFSSCDQLLKSIFSDIESEGRELSEDMLDEVFERYKLLLENFGDDDD